MVLFKASNGKSSQNSSQSYRWISLGRYQRIVGRPRKPSQRHKQCTTKGECESLDVTSECLFLIAHNLKAVIATGLKPLVAILQIIRTFGPENSGPPDRNFQWKNCPPGPIFSVKMVRPWKFGPGYANWKDGLSYI